MLGFKVILCRFQAVWRLYPALSEFINSKFYSPVSLLHHALPQLFTVSLYLPHRILTLGNICENLEGPGYQHKSFGFLSDLPPTKKQSFPTLLSVFWSIIYLCDTLALIIWLLSFLKSCFWGILLDSFGKSNRTRGTWLPLSYRLFQGISVGLNLVFPLWSYL